MIADDRVCRALERLADAIIDQHVVGGDLQFDRDPPFIKPNIFSEHPLHQTFLDALEEDDELNILFPDDDENKRRIRTFRPKSIASRLINLAIWHLAWKGTISKDAMNGFLRLKVSELRMLAAGKKVKTPVLVAYGADFPGDEILQTKFGVLRKWRVSDKYWLSDLEYNPNRGMVLESFIEEKQDISSDAAIQKTNVLSIDHTNWGKISLALLLLQKGADVKPALPWLYAQSQTLGSGAVGSVSRQFRKGPVVADTAELQKWIELVDETKLSEITIHRTNSLFSRMGQDVDAIIDGVIVWENIFAKGGNAELTYRVSMNMAMILGDTTNERVKYKKQIKEIYNLRSMIIHGEKSLNQSEARSRAREVGALTLDAIRKLLRNYPQLVNAGSEKFSELFLQGSLEE